MKRVLIGMVRFYQRRISAHTRPVCRYTPTCSQYAVEALERFGAVKGSLMAARRILSCNPFGGEGYDPVPERFTLKRVKVPVYMDEEEAASLFDADDDITQEDSPK